MLPYFFYARELPKFCRLIEEDLIGLLDEAAKGKAGFDVWFAFDFRRDGLVALLDLLEKIDENFEWTRKKADLLDRGSLAFGLPSSQQLKTVLQEILDDFRRCHNPKVLALSTLTQQEEARLDEAFHTLREECYWSSVVNSAVALESRLLLILKRRNLRLLKQLNPQLIFTLGDLSSAYLDHKQAFKHCIPPRHEHLLKLVNSYRIISAHSKQLQVDKGSADALFNLTLGFLLDGECQPLKKRGPKRSGNTSDGEP